MLSHTKMLGWAKDNSWCRQVVPCFWTQFPAPSALWILWTTALYTTNLVIAVLGNGLTLYLWYRSVRG